MLFNKSKFEFNTDLIKKISEKKFTQNDFEKLSNNNLSKIQIKPIFKWLKQNNVKDSEMLKTFNCGVGFCLIVNKKKIKRVKRIFKKEYQPYEIGFVSKGKEKVRTSGKLKW